MLAWRIIFFLSRSLVSYLQDYGIVTLNRDRNECEWSYAGTYWLSTEDLDLSRDWNIEWDHYTSSLAQLGMRLADYIDSIVWFIKAASG